MAEQVVFNFSDPFFLSFQANDGDPMMGQPRGMVVNLGQKNVRLTKEQCAQIIPVLQEFVDEPEPEPPTT